LVVARAGPGRAGRGAAPGRGRSPALTGRLRRAGSDGQLGPAGETAGSALARVEQAERVEGASHCLLHHDRAGVELTSHPVTLEQADAVLTGHGAAELDG